MMGRLNHDQGRLFYSFCLEEAVPEDHLVRQVAAVLDLSWVHGELAPHYPDNGRPSIDPELMIRMLIIGYVFAIRSERALCRDVQVNLAYRWFCGLSIEDKIPDHSAFSRARNERFRDSDIFRRVFENVVETCIAAGLVGGEGFAVDASLIVADANKQRSIPGAEWNKERAAKDASRAVKEYLATLDNAAFGAASEVMPKFVSPSDPAAQWTGAMRGPAFFAYADNYLVDVKFGVIVDVEATRAIRQAEVGAAKTMIGRTEERFRLKPERLAADSAYGSAATLNWIVNEKRIAPHIPVIEKSKREDGSLSREDFTFDKDRNVYVCPQGKLLHTTGRIHDSDVLLYRARTSDCGPCPLKPKCCPKAPERKIPRSIHEDARDAARALVDTEVFEQSRRDRKRVEMLFAHLKRILKLGRLRLRGPRSAQDEFTLAAIAQNLRRLAKLVARPPPPAGALCAA
jgi:transposase